MPILAAPEPAIDAERLMPLPGSATERGEFGKKSRGEVLLHDGERSRSVGQRGPDHHAAATATMTEGAEEAYSNVRLIVFMQKRDTSRT